MAKKKKGPDILKMLGATMSGGMQGSGVLTAELLKSPIGQRLLASMMGQQGPQMLGPESMFMNRPDPVAPGIVPEAVTIPDRMRRKERVLHILDQMIQQQNPK